VGIDLQKANGWKRISAFLFDTILLSVLAVAMAWLLSILFGFDGYYQEMNAGYARYESEYGVEFDISPEEYAAMTVQDRERYDEAYTALSADEGVLYAYQMVTNLTLVILTVAILLAFLALELIVPLLLKNGMTLGKKIFGICVIRNDGVRMNSMQLFARTVLGKFTVETMIPVYLIILFFFGSGGIMSIGALGIILLAQLILTAVTRAHTPIHDLLAGTVTVDYSSQRIFESTDELIAYTKRLHAERAARSEY